MNLISRISSCLTNNPINEITNCSTDAVDVMDNVYYLIGGLIAKYEKDQDALRKIKKDLQSAVFELQSVIRNA